MGRVENTGSLHLSDSVIILDTLEPEDVKAYLETEDELSSYWLMNGKHSNPESVKAWIEDTNENWRGRGDPSHRVLAIRKADNRELVGVIEFNTDSAANGLSPGAVTLTYQIHPSERGKGLAVNAVRLIEKHLADVGYYQTLALVIDEKNKASIRVAQKAEFKDEGFIVRPPKDRMRLFSKKLANSNGGNSRDGSGN